MLYVSWYRSVFANVLRTGQYAFLYPQWILAFARPMAAIERREILRQAVPFGKIRAT